MNLYKKYINELVHSALHVPISILKTVHLFINDLFMVSYKYISKNTLTYVIIQHNVHLIPESKEHVPI